MTTLDRPGSAWRSALSRDGVRAALLLTPALLVVIVLYGGGVVLAVTQSLGLQPAIGRTDPSLDSYASLLGRPAFTSSVWLTLRLSLVSTVVSAVLAVVAGLLLRGTRRGRRLATFVFQLNLPFPHIVGAAAMLLLLSQSGLVSRGAASLGLVDAASAFPPLTNDRLGFAIMAEYVWKETPFIGVVVLATLQGEIRPLEDVARVLGAGPWQRLRHVVLPLLVPGVASTSIIVFAFTLGSFEVPFLLGQPFPATMPVLAYRRFTEADLAARAEAMAISVVIALLVSVLVAVHLRLTRRRSGG